MMSQLIFLGTGAALPGPTQENTYLVVQGEQDAILVDCAGSPYQRLCQANVDLSRLRALIVTHEHPDHVYGIAHLLQSLWLSGRKDDFVIYALPETMRVVRGLVELSGWYTWPDTFPLYFQEVSLQGLGPVLQTTDFDVEGFRVQHSVPAMGLRFWDRRRGSVLVYSADTEPLDVVAEVAREADILAHESTGAMPGHSSAAQAAEIATAAEARQLVLVHYLFDQRDTIEIEAQAVYAGPVRAAKDFDVFEF